MDGYRRHACALALGLDSIPAVVNVNLSALMRERMHIDQNQSTRGGGLVMAGVPLQDQWVQD